MKSLILDRDIKRIKENDIFSEIVKTKFWHYTSRESAYSIEETHEFWFNSVKKSNDLNERERCKDNIYTFCFSQINIESIPLWYLYAGIDGQGVRFGLNTDEIKRLINTEEVIGVQNEGESKLKINKDFDIFSGWVYYKKNNEDRILYYWRDKCISSKDNSTIIEYLESKNCFIKEYEWNYEKEFRIVIAVHNTKIYDKVVMKIPDDVIKNMVFMVGPQINDEKFFEEVKNKKWMIERLKNNNICLQKSLLKTKFCLKEKFSKKR